MKYKEIYEKYAREIRKCAKQGGYNKDATKFLLDIFELGWDAAIDHMSGQTIRWLDIKNLEVGKYKLVSNTEKPDELLN